MDRFGLYHPNAVAGTVSKTSALQPITRAAKTVAPRISTSQRLGADLSVCHLRTIREGCLAETLRNVNGGNSGRGRT